MSDERQDPKMDEERTSAKEAADQGLAFPGPPDNDPEDPPDEDYPVEGR